MGRYGENFNDLTDVISQKFLAQYCLIATLNYAKIGAILGLFRITPILWNANSTDALFIASLLQSKLLFLISSGLLVASAQSKIPAWIML